MTKIKAVSSGAAEAGGLSKRDKSQIMPSKDKSQNSTVKLKEAEGSDIC
jgi:hypothetical protein